MSKPAEQAARPWVASQLRGATRQAHRRLDHHPLLRALVRADVSRRQYAAALRGLYRPHERLERCVAAGSARLGLSAGEQAPSPGRLTHLQHDLKALGMSLPGPGVSEVVVATTPAALVGHRYVLEGSRLGGELIARRLAAALGPGVPLAFFSASDPEYHWRRFLAFAERHCLPDQAEVATLAAQAAFADYLAALDAAL